MISEQSIQQAYRLAKEAYAEQGVDTDAALDRLSRIAVSVHCWQGDDVAGFENAGADIGGGLAVTGHYPGKARNCEELRSDLVRAYSLIPGNHRLNLHAIYGDFSQPVERNEIGVEHFRSWIQWAAEQQIRLDFNPTFFAHPLAEDGFTLAHGDSSVRDYWVQHGVNCRRIAAEIGRAQQAVCLNNVWIPDGYKDTPASRRLPRERLIESLDRVFAEPLDTRVVLDSVECKLFGIGSESYVVGSHEFYLGYAITRKRVLCLDAGHFHPTEEIADKLSSVLLYVPSLMLHVSRGVRWDSDHVVTWTDELQAIVDELERGQYWDRVYIGLDFFDASINRVAAWVLGTRNVLKAVLRSMLEPTSRLIEMERSGDLTGRLALMEECKSMPHAAVWDYHCYRSSVPVGYSWMDEVQRYERDVQSKRF